MMLKCIDVCKTFGEKVALDHVSVDIPKGKIFGLLGPNGAGKTTLIKMILKQVEIDDGSINISNSTSIGYLSQGVITNINHTLYQEMLLSFKDVIRVKEKVNDILKKLAMARLAEVTAKQPNPEFITIAIHNAASVLPINKVVNFFNTYIKSYLFFNTFLMFFFAFCHAL